MNLERQGENMKLTEVTCKPMTLMIIKSKKNGDSYFKLTGLIPVKENENTLYSANNIGNQKFTTCELFDKCDDVIGISEVIEKFDTVKKLCLSGIWVNGSLNVAQVKVIE